MDILYFVPLFIFAELMLPRLSYIKVFLRLSLAADIVLGALNFLTGYLGRLILVIPASAFWVNPLFDGNPYLRLLVAVLLLDLWFYWTHRLLHSNRLFAWHSMHHSAVEMTWSTTYRHNPVLRLIEAIPDSCVVALLGMPDVAAGALLMVSLFTFIGHLNVDIDFGPLRKIIVSPRFHYVHHMNSPEYYNKNFAGIFAFWDVLFGSYSEPPKGYQVRMGLPDTSFTNWFPNRLLGPINKLVVAAEYQVPREAADDPARDH